MQVRLTVSLQYVLVLIPVLERTGTRTVSSVACLYLKGGANHLRHPPPNNESVQNNSGKYMGRSVDTVLFRYNERLLQIHR